MVDYLARHEMELEKQGLTSVLLGGNRTLWLTRTGEVQIRVSLPRSQWSWGEDWE